MATKISPHQIDLRDVLALPELRGTLPEEAVAIGLQPVVVEMTTELSDIVSRRVDELVCDIVRQLAGSGHGCTRWSPVATGGDWDSAPPAASDSMTV